MCLTMICINGFLILFWSKFLISLYGLGLWLGMMFLNLISSGMI